MTARGTAHAHAHAQAYAHAHPPQVDLVFVGFTARVAGSAPVDKLEVRAGRAWVGAVWQPHTRHPIHQP